MYFYRIAGAVMLVVSGMVGAYLMNSSESRALSQADCYISLLRYIRIQVECFAMPMGDIIRGCDRELLTGCGFRGDIPPLTLDELIGRCEIVDGEIRETVKEFADSFGKGYRDEQLRECDYYIELLCERRRRIADELPKRKKLNTTLCVSWALALVILFL